MPGDPDRRPSLSLVLAGLGLLLVASRWFQLASPHLVEDGDEAIVGVMVQQVVSGGGLPLFFYGQSYALAVVELLGALAALPVFGAGALSLKVGGLLAWAVGLGLFATAVSRLAGTRVAALAAGALLFVPAWGRVTMMYTGALVVSSAALWLAARLGGTDRRDAPEGDSDRLGFGALGAACAVLFFVHPLWLATVAPFVPFRRLAGRRGHNAVALGVGAALAVGAVWLLGDDRGDYWSPPLLGHTQLARSLLLLPERLYVMASGHYFLADRLPMGPANRLATTLWCVATLAAWGGLAWRWRALERRVADLAVRAALAVAAIAGFSLLIDPALFGPRYLLPLTPAWLLGAALGFEAVHERGGLPARAAAVLAGVVMLASGAALVERRHVSTGGYEVQLAHPEPEALEALVRGLEERGVHHVYSLDPMLQWNLVYRSRGAIVARWLPPTDRRPEAPRAVDRALAEGAPVALVGRLGPNPGEIMHALSRTMPDVLLIPPHFFAAFDPTPALLEAQGFILSGGESP